MDSSFCFLLPGQLLRADQGSSFTILFATQERYVNADISPTPSNGNPSNDLTHPGKVFLVFIDGILT